MPNEYLEQSRDAAVMRALTSHQCGPDLILAWGPFLEAPGNYRAC